MTNHNKKNNFNSDIHISANITNPNPDSHTNAHMTTPNPNLIL